MIVCKRVENHYIGEIKDIQVRRFYSMSSSLTASDMAIAAGSEMNKFVCGVVSDTFSVPFESVIELTQKSREELFGSNEDYVSEYGIDIPTLLMLIEEIMAMVMEMINNCPNANLMRRIVKNQRPVSRAWFKANCYNKITPTLRQQSGLSLKKENDLFESICTKASDLSEAEINAIVEETKTPNFDIF